MAPLHKNIQGEIVRCENGMLVRSASDPCACGYVGVITQNHTHAACVEIRLTDGRSVCRTKTGESGYSRCYVFCLYEGTFDVQLRWRSGHSPYPEVQYMQVYVFGQNFGYTIYPKAHDDYKTVCTVRIVKKPAAGEMARDIYINETFIATRFENIPGCITCRECDCSDDTSGGDTGHGGLPSADIDDPPDDDGNNGDDVTLPESRIPCDLNARRIAVAVWWKGDSGPLQPTEDFITIVRSIQVTGGIITTAIPQWGPIWDSTSTVDVLLRSIVVFTGKTKGNTEGNTKWGIGITIQITCLGVNSLTVQFSHTPYNYSWRYLDSIS